MVNALEILSAPILLVDDQQPNVVLLEQMLAGAGYTAVTATTDPRQVAALHQKYCYALIVLDLQMPGMDGFEVMRALGAIEEDDYLPVLVVTAQPAYKLRALQAGARDFISKPFDLAEVLMRVRNMIEVRLLHRTIRWQSEEVRRLYDQVVVEQQLAQRLALDVLPAIIAITPDADIRPLVPAFLDHRRHDVGALSAALERGDYPRIGLVAHAITETGRGYGFEGMTEIGSAIERAAHHGDRNAVHTRIAQLSAYLDRVHVMA